MHLDAWVLGQPVADLDSLGGGVVVHDQVQLLVGVSAGHVLEETQELLMGVPVLTDPRDLAGGNLQRGEQRCGAVTNVVMGPPFRMARLHRRHRLGAIQGLDLGFLVHAQNDRVLRWIQVQPDPRR
ncbi:hypothetical protein LAUMK136_05684 [Mycobacterium attenuatum]|uniref:Uncharacterized protein n=1 Tax=Mycobacterium attenuatum TaxID=2341086 RepID=A0A498QLW3_9MYCO|nr:hypothetical protein LAUMK136_05684 [Mycobacterium attenuatum]